MFLLAYLIINSVRCRGLILRQAEFLWNAFLAAATARSTSAYLNEKNNKKYSFELISKSECTHGHYLITFGNFGNYFARCRIHGRKSFSGFSVDKLIVDKQLKGRKYNQLILNCFISFALVVKTMLAFQWNYLDSYQKKSQGTAYNLENVKFLPI